MSESSGDPYGGNDTYGGGHDTPAPPSQYESVGVTPPTSQPPGDTPQDSGDCHSLLDLDGFGSLISGLIDVDVGGGSGDGTHAAALIDVDLGGADVASVSVLGGVDVAGGAGTLGGLDSLGTSCLLDGLLCDGILS